MATTVECIQVALEETPRYENAPVVTPYQVSTDVHYLPIQTARVSPNPSFVDRSDELRGIEGGVSQLIETYEPGGSLAMRAYPNSLTWLLAACGLKGVFTAGGAAASGVEATTATGVNSINSAVTNVGNTDGFPTAGSFVLGGVATTYTGKTATSFTGCGTHAATVGGEAITDLMTTGAGKWVFSKRTGLTAKTLQIILAYANSGVFLRAQGVGVSGINLSADGTMSADLMGLVLANVADPNLTPSLTPSAVYPARRGDLVLSWLTGSGTTDDYSIAIANSLVRRRSLSVSPASFFADIMEQGDDKVRLTGSIPKSKLVDADVDALLAASTFAAKSRWTIPVVIGASSYNYKILIDMPKCQYLGGDGPDELANRRRFGGNYNFWAAWDETAGYDFKVSIANSITSIDAGSPAVGT